MKFSGKWKESEQIDPLINPCYTHTPYFIMRMKSASSQNACVQPRAVMTFVLCSALIEVLYNHHRYSLRLHSFLGYMTNTEISNRF